MAVELLHRRGQIMVRRGYGIWLLFLAWVAVGVLLLQVNAPNAVPGGSGTRYFTFGYRFGWYLAATIALIYVYNMRDRLSTTRLMRAVGTLFVTVVVGGVVGTAWPHLNFPSAIELILPGGLKHIQFVHDTVHPVIAQLYSVDGFANPRASAPFAYTNEWGLNFGLLLPFFLAGWLGRDSGWRRRVAPIVLLAAVYPLVVSGNRGLWVALVVSVVLLAVRAGIFGRTRTIGAVFALIAAMAVIVLATPLGQSIQTRLDNGYSNQGRVGLADQTVAGVVNKSPVVGLGSTRNLAGSFYSIAGGDTATCGLCTPPALGTQGHLWLVIFSTGVAGLVLYLGFTLGQFVRHFLLPSRVATVGLTVIAVHIATMTVYDAIGISLVTVFLGIALLWREAAARDARAPAPGPARKRREVTVASYGRLLRGNATLILVCMALGLIGGAAVQYLRGTKVIATTSVLLRNQDPVTGTSARAQTLDTVAQLIRSPRVLHAAGVSIGAVDSDDPAFYVTATANTRVLHLHLVGHDAATAQAAVDAAATNLLGEWSAMLAGQNANTLAALQHERSNLDDALASLDTMSGHDDFVTYLRRQLARRAHFLDMQIAQVSAAEATPAAAGQIIARPHPQRVTDAWIVALTSGMMIGLFAGVSLARARQARGRRIGRRNTELRLGGLPVLSRLPGVPATSADAMGGADRPSWLARSGTFGFISADRRAETAAAAAALETWVHTTDLDANRCAVAVVAGPRTRTRDVEALRARLDVQHAAVSGLVLVGQDRASPNGKAADLIVTSRSRDSR